MYFITILSVPYILTQKSFICPDKKTPHLGRSKDKPELLEAINKALGELIEDGTVAKIVEKYIPAE